MNLFSRGLALTALACACLSVTAGTKLLRFPDIHDNVIVFSYAGDLWRANATGGSATRLTTHPGLELFPRISPDGQWLAFTGQYEGDEQVYVMPMAGGEPKQLTFFPARGPLPTRWGYDHQVYGWSADSKSVLFRSHRDQWDLSNSNLYLVPVSGGMPERLAMPKSGAGDLSPDGKRVVYSPLGRDFRSWKRYQGGWASDLYIFDIDKNQAEQITDHDRSDRDPMWLNDGIYFNSDRGEEGRLNLYRYDVDSKQTTRVTNIVNGDVRWPGNDADTIVFELNGELHTLEAGSTEYRKVKITVPTDGVAKRPEWISVANRINDVGLSPKGNRALFSARGDIFSVPVKHGVTRNLTQSSDAHDRAPAWSPNGKHIAYISDQNGEEQIWLMSHDGSDARALTNKPERRLYQPTWSPDSSHLAFQDQHGRLTVIDVASGKETQIADEIYGRVGSYDWSPKSGYIAFLLSAETGMGSIHIWSREDGQVRQVTSDHFNETDLIWGPKGDYLFYLAHRTHAPMMDTMEWNYATDRRTGVFALALRKDVAHPFPPRNDEAEVEASDEGKDDDKGKDKDKDKDKGKEGDKDEEKPKYIAIDWDGLAERVAMAPVPADNYFGLSAIDGHLLMIKGGPFYYGRGSHTRPTLMKFSFKDRKADTLIEGIGGYALTSDRKKMGVFQNGRYTLYAAGQGKGGDTINTRGLKLQRIPEQEWRTVFNEVWRRFRDYFYVENMHGYDWEALRDQYAQLLEHVAHRADLNYIISEMIAELNVSHAYISGGDLDLPDRPRAGLLGARFELDKAAGRYKIATIMKGQNEESIYRSPLTEVGLNIDEGDYLLAINGTPLTAEMNPFALLRNAGGGAVELTVGDTADMDEARNVLVNPIGSENNLLYLAMITKNMEIVDKATDGRVGYIHIPDMGANGIREFIKWYYPQLRKEGMVVDVRGNGGGNVSRMLIERLSRELLNTGFARTNDSYSTYPGAVFHGNLVCLLNETSASDGDIFPYTFRKAGLGPLIGKRSWGGVVGITSHGPLMDGGSVNVPEFGFSDADGSWAVEGYGVDPDIEVDNDPTSVLNGKDPQLERGIEEVLKAMKANPKKKPVRSADPIKTK